MFQALTNKINSVKQLSLKNIYHELFLDKEFNDFIIELNTQTQLYEQGIDSTGESIGEYSAYTKMLKKEKGQITDHVTLKDTGEFYKSFKTYWNGFGEGEIVITANPYKTDDEYGTTN